MLFSLLVLQQLQHSKGLDLSCFFSYHDFNGCFFAVKNLLKGAGSDLMLLTWRFYGPC